LKEVTNSAVEMLRVVVTQQNIDNTVTIVNEMIKAEDLLGILNTS